MKSILFSFLVFVLFFSSCYMSAEQRSSVLNFDINNEWKNNFDYETPPGEDVPIEDISITDKNIIVRKKGFGDDYVSNDTNTTNTSLQTIY